MPDEPTIIDVDDVPTVPHRAELRAVQPVIDEVPGVERTDSGTARVHAASSQAGLASFERLAAAGPPSIHPHPRNQTGASLVEYALLVALIAVVCIAAVEMLADESVPPQPNPSQVESED